MLADVFIKRLLADSPHILLCEPLETLFQVVPDGSVPLCLTL